MIGDTDFFIDLMRGRSPRHAAAVKKVRELEARGIRIAMTAVTRFELSAGIEGSSAAEQERRLVLQAVSAHPALPLDGPSADRAGKVHGALSARGTRIPADDAMIEFSAKDPSSPLARAEYSIDAGPWMLVRPIGQLSDAPSESYRIQLKNLSPGEHTISVRAFDLYENSGIAKITFTVTSPKPARR